MWWLYILLCAFYGNYYVYLSAIILIKKFLFGVNVYVFNTTVLFMFKMVFFIWC